MLLELTRAESLSFDKLLVSSAKREVVWSRNKFLSVPVWLFLTLMRVSSAPLRGLLESRCSARTRSSRNFSTVLK